MNMIAPKAPSAATPERVDLDFARALGHGDLDGATACFAKDGCLITPDLTAVRGRDRIRPVLAGGHLIDGGEVSLVRERWRIRTGREGSRVEQVCDTTLVMQPVEGRWKLIIAAPWGWGDGRV
jgi:ketosteroid isomerase-like protein